MAKFIIPLGFKYGDDRHPYYHGGIIRGPYDSDLDVEHALQELHPGDKDEDFLVFEGTIVRVKPSPLEKPEIQKRVAGDFAKYRKIADGYKCKDCGADIKAVRVAHPIHLRELPGAGPGECHYVEAPYCPNCEIKPNPAGAPVYYGDPGVKGS